MSPLLLSLALTLSSVALPTDDDVATTAAETKPLKVGAKAPLAGLMTLEGKAITTAEIIAGKPTAFVFYRGGWCPYCNAHFAELAKAEADLQRMGIQIVAISPDLPAELAKTKDKNKVGYQLYSDAKADAAKKFGIAFRVDDQTFKMYRDRFRIDLEKASGETHHILPVPSVFLADKSGVIQFAYSNPDYKVRLKAADLLDAARALPK